MSDIIKVLGQVDTAATTVTTLYTVPNLTQTTISSFVACNRTGSAITFRLSVHVAGASADDKQYLLLLAAIASFITNRLSLYLTNFFEISLTSLQ